MPKIKKSQFVTDINSLAKMYLKEKSWKKIKEVVPIEMWTRDGEDMTGKRLKQRILSKVDEIVEFQNEVSSKGDNREEIKNEYLDLIKRLKASFNKVKSENVGFDMTFMSLFNIEMLFENDLKNSSFKKIYSTIYNNLVCCSSSKVKDKFDYFKEKFPSFLVDITDEVDGKLKKLKKLI